MMGLYDWITLGCVESPGCRLSNFRINSRLPVLLDTNYAYRSR